MKSSLNDADKFRLIEIKTFNNQVLGNININFTGNEKNPKYFYSTLIIGPNGSGKSNILRLIIDIFRELEILHKDFRHTNGFVKIVDGLFSIKYKIWGDEFYYSRWLNFDNKKGPIIKRNNKDIDYSEIALPDTIIANSIMLTDKFLVPSKSYSGIYTYQGVRSTPSAAGTRAYIRKTVNLIMDSMNNETFTNCLEEILNTLDFEKRLYISFSPRYRSKFIDEDFYYDDFCKMFEDWKSFFNNRKTEPWGKKYYDKLKIENKNRINDIYKFFKFKVQKEIEKKGRSYYFEYEVINEHKILEERDFLRDLQKLDLISYPTITLKKKNQDFDIAESSAGEYHLISSMISILAKIKNKSLILIDEPDVSLHPNWQMQYMDYLTKFFSDFSGCHFIIATHSHFLVSDLRNTNTSIIALQRDDQIIASTLEYKTYGWSTENILYTVFNMKTNRNYYIERELNELLNLIHKEDINKTRIIEIITHLKMLNFDINDPILKLIETAEEMISGDKKNS